MSQKRLEYADVNHLCRAGPIARALDAGADVVITGRCVDSALALGALVHEFGWSLAGDAVSRERRFDRLAMGSLAGHLIECGAQCTGGIFTDWRSVPDLYNIGLKRASCIVY